MKKLSLLIALMCASVMVFADPIASEYCAQKMSSGNTEAAFVWETDENGSIIITILETLGGPEEATHFRGNGINIDKIEVGETKEPAATYFDLTCGGAKTITLSLKDKSNAPSAGTKIYVSNKIIEYTTSKDGNAWPTLTFEYTYGGVCLGDPVLNRISLSASANWAKVGEGITLTSSAVDQLNKQMDVSITYEVSPATAGSIKDNVYTPAKVGAATITAKSGEVSTSITLYGITSGDNIAKSKTSEAGYNPENKGEQAGAANDGNESSAWVTWAGRPADEEWWYVDLGEKYDLEGIEVLWGADCSSNYILQVRTEAPAEADKANDEAWTTVATVTDAERNSAKFSFVMEEARYFRLHSLAKSGNCIRIKEVLVFGNEWKPKDDTEKPVMVSAEVVSKDWQGATIVVDATDNYQVKKYHVVDAANSIDTICVAVDNKIVFSNLKQGVTYNFVITAIDIAGNESANNKTLEVAIPKRLLVPDTSAPVPTWPAKQVKSLYSDAYKFAPATLNSYNEGWWNNPKLTEEQIGEDKYLHYELYREGMIGVQFSEISVASMEKVHIDIFASAAGTITFRFITAGDPDDVNNTRKTLTLEAGKWNSFDFDLADFGAHNWTKLFQYSFEMYKDGGLVGEHISVDNIYLYRTTELVDNEKPTNLKGTLASVAYFSAVLTLSAEDESGVVSFIVKDGDKEIASGGGESGKAVNVTVTGLKPNTAYDFSVIAKDEADNATEPIVVKAKTLAAPAAAPQPDLKDKQAVAVFSDAIKGGPAINIGGWGQTTVATSVELAEGDRAFYLQNTNYLGWELNPVVNASEMEYLHIDLFSKDMTALSLTPISPGEPAKEGSYTINLKANEWVSADIPLSAYEAAGIAWDNIFQFKFMNATPEGKEVFIDNVYFFKGGKKDEGIEDVPNDQVQSIKFIENGRVIILKNGVRYNILGGREK